MSPPQIGAAILMVLGVAIAALGARQRVPRIRAAGLLLLLTGFFVLLAACLWRPEGESPWLGTLLLAGAAGIFRLMASFEAPEPRAPGPSGPSGTS